MSARFDLPAAQTAFTTRGAIAYAASGQGEPVLAIHGGMGGYEQSWILAQALFPHGPAIAVARPGYPGTPLQGRETAEQQADLYAALLDQLGLGPVLVAAISVGGPSAIQFAVRHPTRCKGLILVSTATGRLQTPPQMLSRLNMMAAMARIPFLTYFLRRKAMKDPLAAALRSIPDPALATQMLAHPDAGALFRLFQQSLFRKLLARLPGTRNDITGLSDLAPLPLGQIAVPVLAIHGANDPVVAPAHAEAVAAQVPGARLLLLEGAGHVALFTHIDAIRQAVADFASVRKS